MTEGASDPDGRIFVNEVEGLPPPFSPTSFAVRLRDMCWISGQISCGPNGRYLPGEAAEEGARAFDAIFRIAEAAGLSRADIVYVDIAFQDLDDLTEINALYARLFPEGRRPARTIYQAARLPFGAKIKVQAVAAR